MHHLRAYQRPTLRPAPGWPGNSTAGALHRHRRGQGSSPVQASIFQASL